MDIKMIALDLDGTTLNSAGKLSKHTGEVLEEAGRRGVHVVVSTGRVYTALPEQVKGLSGIHYAITSNGAHINRIGTGESIYDDFLSEKAVVRVAELSKELDAPIEVFTDSKAYIGADYYEDIRINGCPHRNAEYVLWSRRPVPDIIAVLLENKHKIENVNFCFRSIEHLEESRAAVEAIPEATITSSFLTNLEVGGPNTSKKTALIALMKMLGVEREQLMCCGDAPNDIEMIEFAGLGVAVGNAWGGTKDHADYVTGTNDEDGVAQAIEKFVLK